MNDLISEVRITDNFELFEQMIGNRNDAEIRSKRIEESVKQAGRYIPAPIIVTDKDLNTGRYPIVDGQARFAYCKKTNTPIAYCVIPGLSVNDCISMNASTSNWKIQDYITSYAERGIESYVRTKKFINECPYPISIALWALLNSDTTNQYSVIKAGKLNVTEEMFNEGKKISAYWDRFKDILTNRKKEFLIAIGYCYIMDCVDKEILVKKVHQRPRDFTSIASVTDAIDIIEDAYNMRMREHVYIETEYYKTLSDKSTALGKIAKDRREARQARMKAND